MTLDCPYSTLSEWTEISIGVVHKLWNITLQRLLKSILRDAPMNFFVCDTEKLNYTFCKKHEKAGHHITSLYLRVVCIARVEGLKHVLVAYVLSSGPAM